MDLRWFGRALVLLAVPFGCGPSPDDPIERAEQQRRIDAAVAKQQRAIALDRCQTSIEVYVPGTRPQRPFRVIGPVEGNWGLSADARFDRMRKKACELGAHAIIDAAERYHEVNGPTTTTLGQDAFGRPVATIEESRSTQRTTSALAIIYVDVPATAPAPVSAPAPAPAPPVATSTTP